MMAGYLGPIQAIHTFDSYLRLDGLHNLTYADRIDFVKLDSFQERRLRFDIMFTYKIWFGLVNMNCSDMFAFNDFTATRAHSV